MRPRCTDEILNCPFCGALPTTKGALESGGNFFYYVKCTRCSANTKKHTKYEAIENWNRRIVNEKVEI